MKSLFIQLTNRYRQLSAVCALFVILLVPNVAFAEKSFSTQVTGKGQPVILIPGLMSNASVWEEVSQQMSKSYQVHVISIAGFAGTPSIGNLSLRQVKSELLSYIQNKQLKQPVIIGHSLGGFMAFWLASHHPDNIAHVISVDGLPFIGPIFTRSNNSTVESLASQANMIRGMYHKMSKEQLVGQTKQGIFIQATSPENQARVLEMAAQSDPVTVGNVIHEMLSTDLRNDIANINSQSLLIGASGAFTSEKQHQAAEALYRQQLDKADNVALIMNTNDRHFIMFDNPEWLIEKIQSFLSEVKK